MPYSFRRLYGGYPADIIRHEIISNVPHEKPLESVYPEFGIFLFGRSVIEGAFQGFWTVLKYETGGWKQWVRLGNSYSKSGDFQKKSLLWGGITILHKKDR